MYISMQEKEVYLFEISWEVCNKVGGIYTVLSSKAPYITPRVGNYTFIGPYLPQQHQNDFVEEMVPLNLRDAFSELKSRGIFCHYGRWLIKTEPKVILVDFSNLLGQRNEIKKELWERYGVDSMNAGFDFDEPVVFSVAVANVLDVMQNKINKKIIAQFHEWLTGAGILWLRQSNKKIATIFTTHATVLGRSLAGVNSSFYSMLSSFDTEKEARTHGVLAKHHIEKNSAKNADIFATVSEITSFEAEHILGRKPDILLPNGIDLSEFSSFEDLSIRHSALKHDAKNFIMSFFFPYYAFDLDNTLLFFVMGRYEFENKGIDVMIESLGMLNDHLKKEKSDKTIVTFLFIPAATSGISHEVIENKTIFADLRTTVEKERNNIVDKIVYLTAAGEKIKKDSPFSDYFLDNLQKKVYGFKKKGIPPLSTHDLLYYDGDAIIQAFKRAKLLNQEEDKVKVIFYPAYLKSSDNLLNLELYDAITSGHLGIFASAYEPWGYTPLESAALGVASVTSDLSGFGRYIEKEVRKKDPGIFILKRLGVERQNIVTGLFDIFKYYTSLDKEERIENKIEARRLAGLADWKKLIENYFQAYDLASSKNTA
jgi:glycogen(starch) synthase